MQGHALAAAALLALAASSRAGAAGAAVAGVGAAVSSTAVKEVSSAFIPGALPQATLCWCLESLLFSELGTLFLNKL